MPKPAVKTFGKYQILERIATGGMAEIYRAKLEGIGGFQRIFAIKRILPHLSQDAEYVAMLVEEAKVAGLLSHANIVQIVDLGQVDGFWYIAMEFVDGPDLGAVLARARDKGLSLPVPHAVFVTIELLKGLEYAHQRQVMRGGRTVPLKIIHRDISPPNILLSYQGEVKLTDFGIARASHKALQTHSGVIKGRWDYMSPEQAMGSADLDQRSDLFSAGVVLYEMLTGAHPFRDRNEVLTLERIRDGAYRKVSERNPDVPFALEAVVERALQVDRNKRFPTATAFKEALDSFFHESGFIFTHATLEAYVQGLFPDRVIDRRGRDAAPSPTDAPPRPKPLSPPPPPEQSFLAEGPDDPTRLMDRGKLDLMPPREDYRERGGEDPTLIRMKGRAGGWDDNQPTEVQPASAVGGDTVETKVPDIGEAIDRAIERTHARREKRRRAMSLATALMGVMLMISGFILGGVTAAAAYKFMAPNSGPFAATAVAEPELRVIAPPSALVRVNGQAAFGPLQVAPDHPYTIEVEASGFEPWRDQVTLAQGELRVVVVTLTALNPKPGEPR